MANLTWTRAAWLAYVLFLLAAILFVRQVLINDSYVVKDESKEESVREPKDIKVRLVYERVTKSIEYSAEFTDRDTVEDLLKRLRDDNGFYYEKNMYSDGLTISDVFGEQAQPGYVWAVLLADKNLTRTMADDHLVANAVYVVKQIPNR